MCRPANSLIFRGGGWQSGSEQDGAPGRGAALRQGLGLGLGGSQAPQDGWALFPAPHGSSTSPYPACRGSEPWPAAPCAHNAWICRALLRGLRSAEVWGLLGQLLDFLGWCAQHGDSLSSTNGLTLLPCPGEGWIQCGAVAPGGCSGRWELEVQSWGVGQAGASQPSSTKEWDVGTAFVLSSAEIRMLWWCPCHQCLN